MSDHQFAAQVANVRFNAVPAFERRAERLSRIPIVAVLPMAAMRKQKH
jgi:hypothetical protein